MKINKKIQSFTLSEMIVVLILTSIVIGLAFSVLRLVQKNMLIIQDNYNNNLELNKLETSLWLDFNRYSKIDINALENKLTFKNEIDSTTYKFSEKNIITQQDTFTIELESKQFYFDGIISNSQVDAIKLKTAKTYQNKTLFVFKKNDATLYLD